MRNNSMDIENMMDNWQETPTQQRENRVHGSVSLIRMDLPLAQDSRIPIPTCLAQLMENKEPRNLRAIPEPRTVPRSLLLSCSQFKKIKSPMHSFSDLPCLKSHWNISCLVFFLVLINGFPCAFWNFWQEKSAQGCSPPYFVVKLPGKGFDPALILVCSPAPFHRCNSSRSWGHS